MLYNIFTTKIPSILQSTLYKTNKITTFLQKYLHVLYFCCTFAVEFEREFPQCECKGTNFY